MSTIAEHLGVALLADGVICVPAPDAGPVRDALDVVIQLALSFGDYFPEGSPLRDRVDHAAETLQLVYDGKLPELGMGLPEALDKILFGSRA